MQVDDSPVAVSTEKPLFFFSDAHIHTRTNQKEAEKQDALVAFLHAIKAQAGGVFVVGDLFDFWFEYGAVVPRHGTRVMVALAELVDAGIPVTCLGGNHDWWLGKALEEEYGVRVHRRPLWLRAQGKTLFVAHGDGLSGPDRYYRLVRMVLHNRLSEATFRVLHPSCGAALANLASRTRSNREYCDTVQAQITPAFRPVVAEVFARGASIAVFGHVHTVRLELVDGNVLAVLGDWVNLRSYGQLREGTFRIGTWWEHGVMPRRWG